MPRKKNLSIVPTGTPGVPDELMKRLQETPGAVDLYRKKISVKSLDRFVKRILTTFAPSVITASFETIRKKAIEGDMEAAKTALQIYSILQKGSGISVINTIQNSNISAGRGDDVDFDAIIRRSQHVIDVAPEGE